MIVVAAAKLKNKRTNLTEKQRSVIGRETPSQLIFLTPHWLLKMAFKIKREISNHSRSICGVNLPLNLLDVEL